MWLPSRKLFGEGILPKACEILLRLALILWCAACSLSFSAIRSLRLSMPSVVFASVSIPHMGRETSKHSDPSPSLQRLPYDDEYYWSTPNPGPAIPTYEGLYDPAWRI